MSEEILTPHVEEPKTMWNKAFICIFLANFALNTAMQTCSQCTSLLARELGATASQIGFRASLFTFTAFIMRWIAGPAMNSVNRRYLFAAGNCFLLASYIGFSRATTVTQLMLFSLLGGISNGFGNACCVTMVSDVVPKNRLASAMGIFAVAQSIGKIVGPPLGLQLREWIGFKNVYLVASCFVLFSICVMLFLVKLPDRPREKFHINLHNMFIFQCWRPALITLFAGMGFTVINAHLVVFAKEQGIVGNAGLYTSVYAAMLIATQPLIGRLNDKFGFAKVGSLSILMTSVALILIGRSTSLWMLIVAAVVNAFGWGSVQPAVQSLCIKSAPEALRGSAAATYFIALDVSTMIGPNVAGAVADKFGYTALWPVMAIPVAIAALIALIFRKDITKVEEDYRARATATAK